MSARRFAVLVFLGTLLMQAAWIAVMPPFRGIDEFDHAFRASAVAHGEWEAGLWAKNGRGRLVTVPASLAAAAKAQCADLKYVGPDNCEPVETLPNGMVRIASSAAGYSPVYYWVVGTAGRPFTGSGSLYAMRISSAFLCAVFVALGAWCLVQLRVGVWSRVGLLLSLTPVAYYTTTIVAPNGLEIAAALALWCALLALPRAADPAIERRLLYVAGPSAVVLAGLRELGPYFLVTILLVTTLLDPRGLWGVVRRHPRTVAFVGTVAVAAAIAFRLWRAHESTFGPQPFADHQPPMRASFIIQWQLQVIAAFPFRDQAAPGLVYVVVGAFFLAFVILALRRSTGRLRLVMVVLLVGVFLMPVALTAATYSGRGAVWQGRYGLPLMVGVPLVASLALTAWKPRREGQILYGGSVLMAVANATGLVKVLLDERVRPESNSDPAWHIPSPALVVAAVACAWLVYALAVREAPDADR